MAEKEKPVLQFVFDLKAKTDKFVVTVSEYSQQLASLANEVLKLNGQKKEAFDAMDRANREAGIVSGQLLGERIKIASERKVFEDWKAEEIKRIEAMEKQARQDFSNASNTLVGVRKREVELGENVQAFENKKRDLESKFSKVKELVA